MSAQFIFLSMSAIQQYQLAFSCSVFLTQFFFDLNFHAHFLLFFCLTNLILTFEILIKFIITNSYFILYYAFLEKSLICFFFSSCFVFLFEISVKFSAMNCYLISCSISRKDFCLHFQISEVQISLMFVYNA